MVKDLHYYAIVKTSPALARYLSALARSRVSVQIGTLFRQNFSAVLMVSGGFRTCSGSRTFDVDGNVAVRELAEVHGSELAWLNDERVPLKVVGRSPRGTS